MQNPLSKMVKDLEVFEGMRVVRSTKELRGCLPTACADYEVVLCGVAPMVQEEETAKEKKKRLKKAQRKERRKAHVLERGIREKHRYEKHRYQRECEDACADGVDAAGLKELDGAEWEKSAKKRGKRRSRLSSSPPLRRSHDGRTRRACGLRLNMNNRASGCRLSINKKRRWEQVAKGEQGGNLELKGVALQALHAAAEAAEALKCTKAPPSSARGRHRGRGGRDKERSARGGKSRQMRGITRRAY